MNELLLGKSTVKRRKEAIRLQKVKENFICEDLRRALDIEKDSKNWMTLVEILKAVGFQNCNQISKYILENFIENIDDETSMVVMVASNTLVKITRKDIHDVELVMSLLKKTNYSIKEGVLNTLGYDRMIPTIEQQNEIIDCCYDFGKDRLKGLTDPRYGLAAACAGWESDNVKEFLEYCLKSNDAPLEYVAKNALLKKYVKLR